MVAPAACPVSKVGIAGPIAAAKGAICGLPNAVKAAAVVAAGGLLAYLIYRHASGGASCTQSASETPSETKVKASNPATKRKKRRSKKISRKVQFSDPDLSNLAPESPVADRPPSAYLDLNTAPPAAPSSDANNNSVMVTPNDGAAPHSVSLAPK